MSRGKDSFPVGEQKMTRTRTILKARFLVATLGSAFLVFLYVRALAAGSTPGSYRSISRPWHDITADFGILIVGAIVAVAIVPVLRRGSSGHRTLAVLLLLPVALAFISLIVWLVGISWDLNLPTINRFR